MIANPRPTIIFATRPGAPVSLRTAGHLADIAQFLATHNPTGPFTERARRDVILYVTRTAQAAAPVFHLIPLPADNITRGEAAVRINRTAREHGCAWTGDDGEDQNAPAIPKIPGARPASDPYPAGPAPVPAPRPGQVIAPRALPCPACCGEGGTTVITGSGTDIAERFDECLPCEGTGVRR